MKCFREMTKEERNAERAGTGDFIPAMLLKDWCLKGNDEENSVRLWWCEIDQTVEYRVATKACYAIQFYSLGCGEFIELETKNVFEAIQKATELINFIKL